MTPVGQTADGKWQLGVRRTFPLEPNEAWVMLASPTALRTLLGADGAVLEAGRTFTDGEHTQCEVRSVTPNQVARISWRPPGWEATSVLQLRIISAATGTTIAIHHEGLPDQPSRQRLLERWTAALDRLGETFPYPPS